MTVFVWKPAPFEAHKADSDEFCTAWFCPDPLCLLCGEYLEGGERAMAWEGGGGKMIFHAECMARAAPGFIKDITECWMGQSHGR